MEYAGRERRKLLNLRRALQKSPQYVKDMARLLGPDRLCDFDGQLRTFFTILEKSMTGDTNLSPMAMARGHRALAIKRLSPWAREQRLDACPGVGAGTLELLKSRGIETVEEFLRADNHGLISGIGRKAFDETCEAIIARVRQGE